MVCTIYYVQTNFRRSTSRLTENSFKSSAPTFHRQAPVLCQFCFLLIEICGGKQKYYPIENFCSLILVAQMMVALHRMALCVSLNYIPWHGAVSTNFGSVWYYDFLLKFICQVRFSFEILWWLYADRWETLPGFEKVTHKKVLGASMEITGCRRKLHSGNILTEFLLDK